MDLSTTSRRSFLSLALAGSAAAALSACGGGTTPTQTGAGGGTGGGAPAAGGAATYWFLSAKPGETIRQNSVDRFNAANPDTKISTTLFQNDAYKTKIKTALGAGQGPTIIWGWGGGGLREYVKNDQVEDLSSFFTENPAIKDKLFPSSFGPATIDGKPYAIPCEGVAPIVLYYNKEVFEKVGAQPPTSWGEIMALVPRFNEQGIAPFSLGGQSRWTNMMWLEFLLDRIAGPDVFNNVFAGQQGAWSDPAVTDMLTKVQDLVKAGGFIKGFSSITADSLADQALLYTGKAAMMVHGAWVYGQIQSDAGDFVKSGKLGWMNFPPVEGGKGDPGDTVGNPGQYLSIAKSASEEAKVTAKKFFATELLAEPEVKEWVGTGTVPVVQGSNSQFAGPDAEFLNFIYDVSSKAKVFAQSWDQALTPTAAETLLDNIAKLFQLSISPQQWVDSMNQVIGK